MTVNYADVGSGAGITAFAAKQADFGASDVPMTAAEQAAAKGGQVVQVPIDLGAEGVVYNMSLPAGSRLHLTGPVIARIFLGQITSWRDPAITALNPGINLPDAPISVVHRSDGSGTTYIFSNYLSSVSPVWAARHQQLPITGYSWALVYAHQPSQATGQQLVILLDWLTHDGQTYAAATSYVPLPTRIRQLAHTMLQQVTGPDGSHLLG